MTQTNQRKPLPTVLVLGGFGFIGRYTVAALRKLPVGILIGSRRDSSSHSLPDAVRPVRFHEAQTVRAWQPVLRDVDVVINCVGILRERKNESYEAVHHGAVAALARACKVRGIALVHMSALGITGSVSNRFSLSKLAGERAILASGCHATIVRASVVDAPDGYGSGWFHRLAQWPLWPLPAGAIHKLSPVSAVDLGEALAVLAWQKLHRTNAGATQVLEFGCGEVFTLETYLHRLRRTDCAAGVNPLFICRVPQSIAGLVARVCDCLSLTPYSVGHHELLVSDNAPQVNSLPHVLGRKPVPICASGTSIEGNELTGYAT